MSKLIEKVLPTANRRRVRRQGQVISIYEGISCTHDDCDGNQTSTVDVVPTLPDFCTLHAIQLPHLISFSMPTLYTVNGVNVIVDITMQDSVLHLQIGSVKVVLEDLGVSRHCAVDQRHLDATVTLVQLLRLCRGKPYNADGRYTSWSGPEDWAYIAGRDSEQRVRWKSCKSVVGFNAATDTCRACQNAKMSRR